MRGAHRSLTLRTIVGIVDRGLAAPNAIRKAEFERARKAAAACPTDSIHSSPPPDPDTALQRSNRAPNRPILAIGRLRLGCL